MNSREGLQRDIIKELKAVYESLGAKPKGLPPTGVGRQLEHNKPSLGRIPRLGGYWREHRNS